MLIYAQLPFAVGKPAQCRRTAVGRNGVQGVARHAEVLEQPVGGGPAGGGRALHQRHRQVDADAVAGQHQAGVRGVDTGAVGEVAGREPRAVVAAQHPFADDARAGRLGIELVQAGQQPVAQSAVGCGHRVGVQFDDRTAGVGGPLRRLRVRSAPAR